MWAYYKETTVLRYKSPVIRRFSTGGGKMLCISNILKAYLTLCMW